MRITKIPSNSLTDQLAALSPDIKSLALEEASFFFFSLIRAEFLKRIRAYAFHICPHLGGSDLFSSQKLIKQTT